MASCLRYSKAFTTGEYLLETESGHRFFDRENALEVALAEVRESRTAAYETLVHIFLFLILAAYSGDHCPHFDHVVF